MRKHLQQSKPEKKTQKESTLDDLFKLADSVAKKAAKGDKQANIINKRLSEGY